LLRIQAVCQFFSKTIADPLPQVHEGLTCFDIDIRLLWQEVCHHTNIDLGLLLSHESDGLRAVLIEVRFKGLKELGAQTVDALRKWRR
jgi:hypothetical protein